MPLVAAPCLVDDSDNQQLAFQQALIAAVARVTHIAPVVAVDIINYPLKNLGLCASLRGATDATTEVYPDSPRSTATQCNAVQVAAVTAAIDFVLAH